MKKGHKEEFEPMWTTEKDNYCLIKNGSSYLILCRNQESMVIIEVGEVIDELIRNMLHAGVRVFNTRQEWRDYVLSQPDYVPTHWWEDPTVESPFLKGGRPPKPQP